MSHSGSGTFRRWVVLAVTAWLAATAAWSQNLVGNPDFDSDLSGWTDYDVGLSAPHGSDFQGSPASGSAQITNTNPSAAQSFRIGRCVAVTAGNAYDVGARFFIPSGQGGTGQAELQITWASGGCAAGLGDHFSPPVSAFDGWRFSGTAALVAPGGADSALVLLRVTKNEAGGSFVARGDGVYVRAAGSAPNLLTVHNANDAGPGSLRDAIGQANDDGLPTTIQFDGTLGGQTIALLSALPSITASNTVIDGDLGGDCDPDVVLDGSATTDADGVDLPSNGNIVRGLAIHSFDRSGIEIRGNANVVECSWIGTDLAQGTGLGNGQPSFAAGLEVVGAASDNRIGPGNVIRHNASHGVQVQEDVLFGTYPEFTALLADHTAVFPTIDFTSNCGSFHPTAGPNIIDGSGHSFTENFGMKLTGTLSVSAAGTYAFDFPNVDDEVRLNIDGGAAELDWNGGGTPPATLVALSGSHTIRIDFLERGGSARLQMQVSGPGAATLSTDASPPAGCGASQPGLCGELYQLRTSAQRNTITQNGIGDNGGLGIAFSCCCGPTPNDVGDLDVGPNALLNHPVIAGVASAGGGMYTVSGTAPPDATVEAFVAVVDPSGFGEGNSFLGFGTADGSGNFAFDVPLGVGPTVITTTATDALGNTSEFSANFATGGTADELALGSASGLPATTVEVPIYVRDRSLTPLGIDRPAGERIQRLSFTVSVSPAAGIADLAISKAGITAALTPQSESSTGSLPTETYAVTYNEGSALIPFTSDAAAPGNQVAKLAVSLQASAPAGSYTITFTGVAPNLRNQAGTTIEDESNGTLTVAGGSFTVLSNAAPALQATALSTSLVTLSWIDPNQNETGFRLERSTNGLTWSTVANKGMDDESHFDAGLSPATLYYYRLVTRVGASDSHVSNVATATTFPAAAAEVCRQRITGGSSSAYNVSLVSTGTQWAAAWTDSTPGLEDRVLFQRLDANGAPLDGPLQLSSPGIGGRLPTLAWNGSRFGVLWGDHKRAPDGAPPNDFTFTLLDANGTVLRPHAVIASASPVGLTRTLEPVLLWDGSGWGIFMPDGADSPQELAFYRLDADGDLVLGPVMVTDDPDWDTDYAAAWNGSVYGIAWVRRHDSTYEVWFQTMTPGGSLVGSPLKIRDHVPGTTAQETDLVWNGSGWAVAWTQADDAEQAVFLRLLDPAGNPTNTAQRISDLLDPAFPPQNDVKVVDTFPQLFTKPGGPGGYVIYTWSVIQTDFSNEVGRLEAGASGTKVGQRAILSGQDGQDDGTVRGASDGTNFLVAWEHAVAPNPEILTLKLNANGSTLAGPTALTSGHDGALDFAPAVAALAGGFAALWRHADVDSTELYAKLFDGAGNLAATKTPLVAGNVGGATGVVGVGNTFAVAWNDTDNGKPRFQRFDALGNALTAAVEVAPSGGGTPQLDWSGEIYGVAYASGGLKFQRLAPDGTPVGAPATVNAPDFNGNSVLVRWVGSGWALLWLRNADQNLYYARLDAAGNVVVPPTAVTSAGPTDLRGPRRLQMVFNGSRLGVAWDENRGLDPPGSEIYFTVLDLAGTKQFPEAAVVSHFFSDTSPALYWDLDRFKLVHGVLDGMHEIEILEDGTVTGNQRFLGAHEGTPVAAWNGTVLGLLRAHRGAIEFETDECLADATPPPCPTATASFFANRVALSWSAVADAESGLQSYNVYRDGRLIGEFTPATLAYDDGGFVFGQTHFYEVRALNRALGESASCSTLTVPAFPNAAVALLATALSSSQVRLDWDDPGSNETGFRVERSLDGVSWSAVGPAGPDDTSYVDGGLSPATLYYYRLVTLVGGLDSQISNVATATTFPATAAKVCFDLLVPPDNRSWARFPSAAWNGSEWVVAWQGRELGMLSDDIFLRRFHATSLAPLAGAVQAANTFTSSQRAELATNGSFIALSWVEGVGNPPGGAPESNVFFSLFAADGTPVRENVLVSRAVLDNPLASVRHPVLDWDGTHWGHFAIEAVPGPLSHLVYRRLDWNGDVVLQATKSSATDHLSDVVAAWNPTAGKYGVAWMQIEDTTIEVYFQVMEETTGVFEGSPALLGSYADFFGTYGFDITADGADWAVVWAEGRVLIDESTPAWLARIDTTGAVLSNQRISDALLPPDGFPFDGANRVFRRPSGGYAIYFTGSSPTLPRVESVRLQADANGVRTGTRDLMTPDDNVNSSFLEGAENGADVLLAWNEPSTSTLEIGGLRVDGDGGAPGAVVPLTSGHSPGTGNGLVSAGAAQVAALGAGFVALWTDAVSGSNLLHARIYDGSGAVVATLSPLSATAVAGRPGLAAVGSTFAVAFRVPGGNETRFLRRDATGAVVTAETVISTAPGGPEVALSWSGEDYAAAWRRSNAGVLEFQRVTPAGGAVGPTVEVALAAASPGPQLHWFGNAWGVVTRSGDNSLRYARLSPAGAVEIPSTTLFTSVQAEFQFNFHSAWNGSELGLAWAERGLDDPPLHDIQFAVVDTAGALAFPPVTVVASPTLDGAPTLYWDGGAFRLLHSKGDQAGLREIGILPNGTVLPGERFLGAGAASSAAWNGVTLGIGHGSFFDTLACLEDATPPPCPAVSASFDGDAVHLSWAPVADAESGPPLYVVLRDGTRLATTAENAAGIDDRGFVHGATHDYEVRARNRAFQESVGCTPVSVDAFHADVASGDPYAPFIHDVWEAGVSAGCSVTPFAFCPDLAVTREQMAVFLLRAKEGPLYSPPACSTASFADVPCSSAYADWIYELAARGAMTSCDGGASFCPTDPVTREQMAMFVLRTLEGGAYDPPACASPTWDDVPCANDYAKWVEELTARGVTAGCGGGNYCPTNALTREQMAQFIANAFPLP